MSKDTIWGNPNAEIDESKLDNAEYRLENFCPWCGNLTLYGHKTPIGIYIACASKGCEGGFNELIKKAVQHQRKYYDKILNPPPINKAQE